MLYFLSSTVTAQKDKTSEVIGSVIETLPNTLFRVAVEGTDNQVLAYLSGRMRKNRIKVLVGDTVSMVMDEHGERARIVRRL